ncbi:noncanonical pyrimidine nucleotidase, YjjG family [Erysipelotrichaceae bacterium OH741_COT-311]|nr:noncanonical pyrimidine nucleotidase, YjjG family [Erysipelotrichaceae bacterium OH741_COT-311]
MYKYLLFDLDDTILDFKTNELVSLRKLFKNHKIDNINEVIKYYLEVNHDLWNQYELGQLKIEEVVSKRFEIVLRKFDYAVDGYVFDQEYRQYLSQGGQLMDHAFEVIETLSKHYDLYVVTNGVSETQRNRLNLCKLTPYFKAIFTSKDIGYPKPHKEFFDYVSQNIDGFNPKEALVIGDSLNNDIKGANDYGIDSCWMANNRINDSAIKSTYTINGLVELLDLLAH